MDAREKALKDFEAVTAQIADLERALTEARGRQDHLRRTLRSALKAGRPGDDAEGDGEPQAATVEAVEAVRGIGAPTDAATLAGVLGVSPSVARTRLQRGAGLGLLRRVRRGYYEAVAATE